MSGEPTTSPRVTVVIPTYRRPHMLPRAIESVAAQSWSAWELLIVDDNGAGSASQVATEAVVAPYLRDDRIAYHVLEENLGACAARNTGIQRARGEFVAFLDDDDLWHPDKLETQVDCFQREPPDVALVYGGFRRVLADGRIVVVIPDGLAHRMPRLLLDNSIGTTSLVMCRRSALLAVGGFDERLPAMQDYDLYIRLGFEYPFAWTERVLVDHLRHGEPRISTESAGVIRGHELFYEKHRHLFAADPGIHHHRLSVYARGLLRAGHHAGARALYWRAWRALPRRLDTLAFALLANPMTLAAYRHAKGIPKLVGTWRDARHNREP